jgi:hypothetical protein
VQSFDSRSRTTGRAKPEERTGDFQLEL